MSVTPSDFLSLAKDKIPVAKSESDFRCVVNRAYYGAYHHAKHFHSSLASPGTLPAPPRGAHETLITQLLKPTIARTSDEYFLSMGVGYLLKGIKRLRTKADYELQVEVTSNDANSLVCEATKIFSKI